MGVLLASSLGGCTSPQKDESLTMTGMYFDTVVTIEAWGTSRDILDHCEELCDRYEHLFSRTLEDSEVSKINNSGGQPVTVSDETAELIRLGLEYGDISDGYFDITIASASELWDFTDNEEKKFPDSEVLAEAAAHIDYHNVKVEGNTVTLTDPMTKIDLGGIAKGYIADRLKDYLQSEGVEHALINLGGNMLAVGSKTDGSSFRIGLQKPFEPDGTPIAVLEVDDQSVVTSGNYERYFEKDGTIYHHILNPDTGYPIQNDLYQVSIISDRSVDGDALSTTCYALGLEKGMELIRSLDGVEAVFVTSDYELHTTTEDLPLSQ
ncbi:MAG TPA: FAD:protein FMN transferase [Candidatus Mediterraneibacter intestinavium]|nr:FAD:protein FMN transferase [Candidatus Mediterraneibacter intestinavium]